MLVNIEDGIFGPCELKSGTTGRSILRNKISTDIRKAFYSCRLVGYSLADMTPDIKLWLKAGIHVP